MSLPPRRPPGKELAKTSVGTCLNEILCPCRFVDDFIEAHEITDQRQMLAVSCPVRVSECAGHDVAEFGDVPHVNATYVRINEEPSPGLREGFGPGHIRKQGEQQDSSSG
jgi:hypothetical protein